MPLIRLPWHRLPADAHVPLRLAPGIWTLCPHQSVEEALETAAYLETWLVLVDPDGANCRSEQYRQSKGQSN